MIPYMTYLVCGRHMFEDIKFDSLCKWSTLPNCDNITFSNIDETWRAMNRHILVAFLETPIFRHVLEIISADNYCSLHLMGNNHCLQDTASDRNVTSEWTLFVHVSSFNGFFWSLETKTNTLVISHTLANKSQGSNW